MERILPLVPEWHLDVYKRQVKGCANLETVCDYMKELGVKYVTVYAFSTENWKRSKDEVLSLIHI